MNAVQRSLLAVVAGLALLAGCAGGQADDEINFLRAKPSDAPDMEGLLKGRLVLNEKCLYIQREDVNSTHAAIWPFEFSLIVQDDNVQILNENKEIVAQVGDQVVVGGGQIPPLSREEFEQNFSGPFQCAGFCWLVTDVVETTP